MNILRLSAIFLISMILLPDSATAHCKGSKHTGDHPHCVGEPPPPPPPPPPSTGCMGMDSFPGFLYVVEATRKTPEELRLASSDGCRSEHIAIVPDLRLRESAFHMTADGSKGVILWSEDIDNQYIVRRLDFTVDFTEDSSGVLKLEVPVTVLPLAGEEALPGDFLFLRSIDIWGDAAHDSLYLTIRQRHVFNSGPKAGTGTRVALIYDLNDLTNSREIYNEDAGGWQDATGLDCSSVLYPQFVPTCYGLQGLRFNPSGTRLYMGDDNFDAPDGERWSAALRIHIDMDGGPDLADWILTGPELVFAGPESSGTPNQWAMAARPSNDNVTSQLPEPEYIAAGDFLNADQCAALYAPIAIASGNSEASFDLWLPCVDTTVFAGGGSWQTHEALLGHERVTSHHHTWQNNIYRNYISGGSAGLSQLLIENGSRPDTGF